MSGSLACGSCLFDTSACACPPFPASGQVTAYGAGSDGDLESGGTLSYTDNGDGTITDNNTGLMWEKKSDTGSFHGNDQSYTWCVDVGNNGCDTNNMDGTIATTFLANLNGSFFAGYTDWRIPNVKELESIANYEGFSPAVDPAFHHSATCAGCTNSTPTACSCTTSLPYWSSTNRDLSTAWTVNFLDGTVSATNKSGFFSARPVRAVRGGA
jgi:hypothetical protein